MDSKRLILVLVVAVVALAISIAGASLLPRKSGSLASVPESEAVEPSMGQTADDPNPPAEPVKLIFIHHSCGENWLADEDGGLGIALRDNGYFVSDTNYGWTVGGTDIGSLTDIGHWWTWFRGDHSAAYTAALYTEYEQHSWYTRRSTDPGGENEIIMFKSCYPNSYLGGNPGDPPTAGTNPLRGHAADDDTIHTVANAKGIYNDILAYFATRQDKLFVAVTAPPQVEAETDAAHAANARALNDWLVEEWLDGYPHNNVAVFDFFNVLTSNGGDANTHDAGAEAGNHHRWWSGAVQHIQTEGNDFAAYGSGDSHPTAAGNQKATAEFVPLLNVFYHRWASGNGCQAVSGVSITGPTIGYTNTLYSFTAQVTPVAASTPITYTWSPAPAAGSGALVGFTWATTGTKTITVTAENCGGSAEDSHAITISPAGEHHVYLPLVVREYAPSPPDDRVQPSDLIYRGAFAYPPGDDWAYSGHALAYYPAGDPGGPADGYPGSLYAAGGASDEVDLVAEISIPEPVIASNFEDLPQASALQPLTDITGGWKDNCTFAPDCIYRNVDGLAYLPNVDKVAWNLRDWYNTARYDQDSLGWSGLDMSGAHGVWHIGDRPSDQDLFHNAKTCNYLFKAPESYADLYLDGKWLIAGNHREAGALGGSQGPTLYALAPWEDGDPPSSGQNLDALALLYYPEIVECVWEGEGDINEHPAPGVCDFPDYRAMDNWGGGVWLQTGSGRGILIFGRKGLGDNCYGPAESCSGDPCSPYQGYHAYPYQPQILFYDPEELTEVMAGTREPWEVLPYAIHSPEDEMVGGECAILGAAALDRERGLLYVTEQEAGPWGETVVHVWQVE
jgi:hypothetical protein